MKNLFIGGLMFLTSHLAQANDAFEIVSLQFKGGVSFEEQKILMEKLEPIVAKFTGFRSRDYYYSEENGRWIDFVVWSSKELAQKASEQAMQDPKAQMIFSQIEEKSMIFSHYKRVGGGKKD